MKYQVGTSQRHGLYQPVSIQQIALYRLHALVRRQPLMTGGLMDESQHLVTARHEQIN